MRMRIAAILLGLLVCGCAAPRERPDVLYQDLGGQPGIEKLVTGMLVNIANDDRIVGHFRGANIERLRGKLVEQFCALSGGPCEYTGDDMLQSHAGKNITDADFNALVEDLIAAMEQQRIPVAAQNRLLALLAPMHGDIVYH